MTATDVASHTSPSDDAAPRDLELQGRSGSIAAAHSSKRKQQRKARTAANTARGPCSTRKSFETMSEERVAQAGLYDLPAAEFMATYTAAIEAILVFSEGCL